jgi:hypothetical protein
VRVEGDGGPLRLVIAGANVPDFPMLDETNRAVVVERPGVRSGQLTFTAVGDFEGTS